MKVSYIAPLNVEDEKRAGGRYCIMIYFDDEPVEDIATKAAEAVKAIRERGEG